MTRPRHPDKDIEAALLRGKSRGLQNVSLFHAQEAGRTCPPHTESGRHVSPLNTVKPMSVTRNEAAVSTFHFTVILEGLDDISEELTNRLFEAGCDDTLLRCCDGIVSLDFDRDAGSLAEAIGSAIRDITAAGCSPAQISCGQD